MKILEERFGQTRRVTQACIEDLVAGARLTYGDNIGVMNFSEKLNTATKILQGNVEHEANVATNLKCIISRLPNDLIIKWQNENYEIVKSGRSLRLKDIAAFVKRQASIRNDPVFGGQMLKRENKEPKVHSKLALKKIPQLVPRISKLKLQPLAREAAESASLSVINLNIVL